VLQSAVYDDNRDGALHALSLICLYHFLISHCLFIRLSLLSISSLASISHSYITFLYLTACSLAYITCLCLTYSFHYLCMSLAYITALTIAFISLSFTPISCFHLYHLLFHMPPSRRMICQFYRFIFSSFIFLYLPFSSLPFCIHFVQATWIDWK
jgi:hypothetical protein